MSDEKEKPIILLVDDDDDFSEIISLKLEKSGFSVFRAKNGADGIQQARKLFPNLVLLDVEMPVLNGIQTLAQMQSDPELKKLKVVFLTNYGDPEKEAGWIDEKYARELGALDYIKKTEDLNALAAQVKEVLGNK